MNKMTYLNHRIRIIRLEKEKKTTRQLFQFQPFSQKQKKVLTWWCKDSPVKDKEGIIADGAIRSGKTISMSLSFVLWAMSNYYGQNFGMCGKTIGSFRRNVVFWIKLMLKSLGYQVIDHRADNLIVVKKGVRENNFYIFGGKDERSQDLVQGITLAGVFFDEVALMPESFVNQATGRCSVAGSKMWFNCNPDGPYHWFKTEWIDKKKEKRLLYLHFTMDDNLSLSPKIKARYRSMYTGVFFKRYILGLWTIAEGMIYDMFEKERHSILPDKIKDLKIQYVSCDYGTQNATVFLGWVKNKENQWIAKKEYYYSGREQKKQKTDAEYVTDLLEFVENNKGIPIIVDPSATSFITELRKHGFTVTEAKNDVLDGIRWVGNLLNQHKILFSQDCFYTMKEFNSYIWDEKAAQRGEDKPVKVSDHTMDTVRYFCYTILRKNIISVPKEKKLQKQSYWRK